MYRLAICDFDGTLADSADWFIETMTAAAARFGYREVAPDELAGLRGLPARQVVSRLRVPLWRMPAIARHFRAEAGANLHRIRLFPGARDALRSLHEVGVELAIVSSNAEETIRGTLGGDAARIAHFACGSSLFGKTAKLRGVLRARGIPAVEAMAIGDETRDIDAAKAAGITAAAVTWGYATRDALAAAGPHVMIDTFEEVAATLIRGPQPETEQSSPGRHGSGVAPHGTGRHDGPGCFVERGPGEDDRLT